jgi:hypothetical protein
MRAAVVSTSAARAALLPYFLDQRIKARDLYGSIGIHINLIINCLMEVQHSQEVVLHYMDYLGLLNMIQTFQPLQEKI